jgi:hypothetical protein
MMFAAAVGHRSGRATPSLRGAPQRQSMEIVRRETIYRNRNAVQTNPATSVVLQILPHTRQIVHHVDTMLLQQGWGYSRHWSWLSDGSFSRNQGNVAAKSELDLENERELCHPPLTGEYAGGKARIRCRA